MAIYKKITVEGTQFSDSKNASVTSSSGEMSSSSTAEIIFPNENGVHNNDFNIGHEVVVYSDKNINPPTTKIFTGVIRNIEKTGNESVFQEIRLVCRDYSSLLQDAVVEPEVYNNALIHNIVLDLMTKYGPSDISTSGVQATTRTVERIVFVGLNLFDSIIQLAELAGFIMYVDEEKILHFEEKGTVSSGVTLDSTNVIESSFQTTADQEFFNKVWVYGDFTFTGVQQVFTANGGSVYTLSYNPYNTRLERNGVVYLGGADSFVGNLPSGTQYVVNYYDKTVRFISGTLLGDWIPTAGSFLVDYQRQKQIIKYSEEPASISQYWPVGTRIVDKSIKDPTHASLIASNFIREHGFPRSNFRISLNGIAKLQAGQSVVVNLPNKGVSDITYDIIETIYDFSPETIRSENVVSVSLNKKIATITDTIKNIILDIRKLQAGDIQTDVISRLSTDTGRIVNNEIDWRLYNNQIGNSFVLGHEFNGVLGDRGYGSGAVISGASFSSTFAKHGKYSLYCATDGDTVVYPGSNMVNDLTSGLSICFWARPIVDQPAGSQPNFFSKTLDDGTQEPILIGTQGANPARLRFRLRNYNNTNLFDFNPAGDYVQSGTWIHVACTSQMGDYAEVIVNGSSIGSTAVTGSFYANDQAPIYVSSFRPSVHRGFFGYIDDVRLYNRKLPTDIIGSIYRGFDYYSGLIWSADFEEVTGSVSYINRERNIQPLLGDHRTLILDRSKTLTNTTYAHWKFDDTADSSTNGYNGGLGGNASLIVSDKATGKMLSITTSITDHFNIPAASFSNLSDFSVSFWAKINLPGAGTTYRGIISIMNVSNYEWGITYVTQGANANQWLIYLKSAPGFYSNNDTLFNAGGWHHYVFVRSSTSILIYRDGELFQTFTGKSAVAFTGIIKSYIGGQDDIASRAFNGYLDDFRIHNYALSQAEVLRVYGGEVW